MDLEIWDIRRIEYGPTTQVRDGVLEINPDEVCRAALGAAPDLRRVDVHLVRPAESVRIACVKDVIEPRVARPGPSNDARVCALRGVAVATCGRIVGFQEGLIDMSGPGASYSPFSSLCLLVLEADVSAECGPHRHEAALREAGLAVAECLALAASGDPNAVERFELAAPSPELPRVAYLYMLLSQGLLHDTWVEGQNARQGMPRLADPWIALAGGIVSGNCVSACDKNTTWHHQNNPVIRELFRRHNRDLVFAGCVLTHAPVRLTEKERSASRAVELVLGLEVAGAVISKEGFGNPDADLMMLIRGLENAGVRTVAITDEFAGQDGASQSLADTTPQADAVISVGNANERVILPPMQRTLGSASGVPRLAGAGPKSVLPDGSLAVELQAIVGATNQLGCGHLTALGM